MKCYEVRNGDKVRDGKVFAGFPLVRTIEGKVFVFVGPRSFYEDGVKVFLTDGLAASLEPGQIRIMDAELVKDAAGRCVLDFPSNYVGVLVLYSVERYRERPFLTEPLPVQVPHAPARGSVAYCSKHRSLHWKHDYEFVLAPLFPGESLTVSNIHSEKFIEPFAVVNFDGSKVHLCDPERPAPLDQTA